MKLFKVFCLPMVLLILVAIFTGCASTGFLMEKPKVTMFYKTVYPSKDEEADIDVYRTNTPTQEYVELAEIVCGDINDNWNLQQILKKAREIGADAVIITGKAGSSEVVVGDAVVSKEYGMTAIVIKYRQ
jgi:hypothetical protein